ncbi:MAG: hydroxymethylbilane synthase [Thermoplasmata archaeon]
MTERLRVGTRTSPLARIQTGLVLEALRPRLRTVRFELVPLTTAGDQDQGSLEDLDFTDRIDRELEEGGIDVAVHSTKDLPGKVTRAVTVAAYPRRADPRDCLVLSRPGSFRTLARGARIGSSSVRRRAQLLRWRPDVELVPVRGNVGTRISQIGSEGLAGVVLAAAGLQRLGWQHRITEFLPLSRVLPAPGQGALAVCVRRSDRALARRLRGIDHMATRAAVTAERAVLAEFGGSCDIPLGALATVRGRELRVRAALLSPDGRQRVRREAVGLSAEAAHLGRTLGLALARQRGRHPGGSEEGEGLPGGP